ncbi:MAG TPA: helix-turn-helix transcriptional regulator [Rhodanobacteraceae bacterium]
MPSSRHAPSAEPAPTAEGLSGQKLTVGRFSQIVGAIYAAATDRALWLTALEEIRRVLDGNYASLVVQPSTSDDDGLIVSAASDHGPLDPHNPPLADSPFTDIALDHLVTSADLVSGDAWRHSAYYKQWCEPHDVYHVMAADISAREGNVYGFRVTRSQTVPAFSEADCNFGRQLLPHLKRALDIHQATLRDREIGRVYGRAMAGLMVGVIVLDERGDVLERNSAASSIIDMNDGLRVVGNRLRATYDQDDRTLQKLLRAALAQSGPHLEAVHKTGAAQAMAIGRPSGRFNWGIVVQAIAADRWNEGKHRPGVVVFVRDSEGKADPPVRFAQQLFRLTPAETSLATKLINGLSLEEAANALNIRRNTARAHLRSIFSKTGVRRQAELVRIFLNSVAWFGGSKTDAEEEAPEHSARSPGDRRRD